MYVCRSILLHRLICRSCFRFMNSSSGPWLAGDCFMDSSDVKCLLMRNELIDSQFPKSLHG